MLDLLLTTSVFIFTKNDCFYQLIGKLEPFQGLILITNIAYTSILGNPISEGVPTQPATHIGGQGLNRDAGQTVGQSVKRPTSEMTDTKNRAAKRPKFTDSAAAAPLSRINFACSKMFSSRPTINSRGDVTFGFRHNCELNCFFGSCISSMHDMVLIRRCRRTKPISE